jgi:hypothetical protein
VHRQFLSGLEVEIQDFEIGRIMHQQLFEGFFGKVIFFK